MCKIWVTSRFAHKPWSKRDTNMWTILKTFIWQWGTSVLYGGSFIWQGGTFIWKEGTFIMRRLTILLQTIRGTKFWLCVWTLTRFHVTIGPVKTKSYVHAEGCDKIFDDINDTAKELKMRVNPSKTQLLCNTCACYARKRKKPSTTSSTTAPV